MRFAITAALALAVGCTPGMHRAYQVTMATVATAAWSCDALQTNAAIASNMAVEDNPANAGHPSAARIWASSAGSSALVWGVVALPADKLGDADTGNYLKDMLVTAAVAGEGFVVLNNAKLMDRPALRCGH